MPREQQITDDLLRELIATEQNSQIITLGLAGIPQRDIREIVGVDIYRVNRIVKHLKKSKKEDS
jgi:transposase-like protein